MEDYKIVDLYWARNEQGISESDRKYGKILRSLSFSLLSSHEDAEECVNDTYLDAWNSMPPHRPNILSAFLGKITRRIAIDRWREGRAQKRGGGEIALALDELSECVASAGDVAREVETLEVAAGVRRFLDTLPDTERRIFVRRYWHMEPIADLAERFGYGQSRLKSILHRTRAKLRRYLEKEGLL